MENLSYLSSKRQQKKEQVKENNAKLRTTQNEDKEKNAKSKLS